MGLVRVEMEISVDGGARQRVGLLVDSGAKYSLLPWKVWRALGLKPKRTLEFVLADGRTVRRHISEARFSYQGIDAMSPVILGQRRDEALLGAVTLETMGLLLNPFERTLSPMRMILAEMVRERPPEHAQLAPLTWHH